MRSQVTRRASGRPHEAIGDDGPRQMVVDYRIRLTDWLPSSATSLTCGYAIQAAAWVTEPPGEHRTGHQSVSKNLARTRDGLGGPRTTPIVDSPIGCS